jgi:hypothetical protein
LPSFSLALFLFWKRKEKRERSGEKGDVRKYLKTLKKKKKRKKERKRKVPRWQAEVWPAVLLS